MEGVGGKRGVVLDGEAQGSVLGFCSLHFACMHRTNPNTLTYVDGECAPPPRMVVYFFKYNFKYAFNLIDFL
jgi:hypothetical protein